MAILTLKLFFPLNNLFPAPFPIAYDSGENNVRMTRTQMKQANDPVAIFLREISLFGNRDLALVVGVVVLECFLGRYSLRLGLKRQLKNNYLTTYN